MFPIRALVSVALLSLGLGVSLFGQSPTVTTGSAASVTDLAATLNGTVNPNGGSVTVTFDYGTTTSYGTTVTPNPSSVTGSSTVNTSGAIAGLHPSTTYHCRIKAYASDGFHYGSDVTFTTGVPATPPSITGPITFSSVTTTSAQVQVNGIFAGSSNASISFEYGLTTAYGSTQSVGTVYAGNSGSMSGAIGQLAPNTLYHVRCDAVNGQGSVSSTDATFTTLPAPVVITGSAGGVTDIAATFNGSVTPVGGSLIVSFDYGTTAAYGTSVYAANDFATGTETTNFYANITPLQPATTYHYRAKAIDNNGVFYYGADMAFTTAAPSTPPTVSTENASSIGATTAGARATGISGGTAATLTFNYGLTTAYGSTSSSATIQPATSFQDSIVLQGLQPSTTYHYQAVVSSSLGTVAGADTTFTTLAVPVVTTNPATGVTDITAKFNGTINASGGMIDPFFEYGLTISYGASVYGSPAPVFGTGTSTLTGTPTGLQPGTTYHYRLKGLDVGGVSYYGADMTFTTGPPSTPPTLTSASASANSATTAVATFSGNSGGATATLSIYYGTTASYGSSTGLPDPLAVNTPFSYQTVGLVGLTPGTTYHYQIVISSSLGTVATSDNTFTAFPAPVVTTSAATSVASQLATLNGTANPNQGMLSLYFDYGLDTTYGTTLTASPATIYFNTSPANVTRASSSLQPGTTYHYRLRGVDGGSVVYAGADMTFTTLTPAQNWRMQNFGTTSNSGNAADTANLTGDGINNLMKYALGLNPNVPSAALPQATQKNYGGTEYLSYTFVRNPSATDITYEVDAADSPGGTWTAVATSAFGAVTSGPGFVSESPGANGMINVEVHDTTDMSAAARRFMRLQVMR